MRHNDSRITSETRLRELTREWQKRLRLQDWNIQLRITKSKKFRGYGLNQMRAHSKECRITILHPCRIKRHWLGSHDTEATLVHELLHLHMATFDHKIKGTVAEDALEATIELTALALVEAKRARV